MISNALENGKRIYDLLNEIKKTKEEKKKIISDSMLFKKRFNEKIINETECNLKIKNLFKNKTEKQVLDDYKNKLNTLLDKIKEENSKVYVLIQEEPVPSVKGNKTVQNDHLRLTKEQLNKYLKSLNITQEDIDRFIREQKKLRKAAYESVEFSIYQSSKYGKLANRFVEPLTMFLTKKYPDLFESLMKSLKLVNLNMLSKTYISVIIFSSLISWVFFTLLFTLILYNIVAGIGIGIVMFILTIIFVYYYPSSMIGARKKKIKDELPFAIVHMAAVAGSGTQPINIFKLLVESQEYVEIAKEIKKILNYVNVFGYNLSTALKNVADTTPSYEFRELLNGIISTIETGGDLRSYLDSKAIDSLATYKLDRQRYVETLATYSDIYTGILVAAPLLFVTTLTIINVISPNIGGFTVETIALIGTFGLIPALNIGFIIFLNLTQPDL